MNPRPLAASLFSHSPRAPNFSKKALHLPIPSHVAEAHAYLPRSIRSGRDLQAAWTLHPNSPFFPPSPSRPHSVVSSDLPQKCGYQKRYSATFMILKARPRGPCGIYRAKQGYEPRDPESPCLFISWAASKPVSRSRWVMGRLPRGAFQDQVPKCPR